MFVSACYICCRASASELASAVTHVAQISDEIRTSLHRVWSCDMFFVYIQNFASIEYFHWLKFDDYCRLQPYSHPCLWQEAHTLSDEEHTREVTAMKAEMAAYQVDMTRMYLFVSNS